MHAESRRSLPATFWRAALRTWARLKTYRPQFQSLLVVLWLTLTIVSVVMAAVTWRRLARDMDAAVKTSTFNDALDHAFTLIQDAETGQRGYLITGDESYLAPYDAAITNLPAGFTRLADLAAGDRSLEKDLLDLRVLAELRLDLLREGVALRRTQGFSSAAAAMQGGAGKERMERIRELTARLRRERVNTFTADGNSARRQLNRASLTSFVAGLIGVGTGFIAFYLARVALRHSRRERELAEAKLEAERRSEEKSSFLANMSHEIRTPMNAILGFSELLEGELREPRQRQYLGSIRSSASSLLQLINDVLDMSKIESGVMELHPEPTDPREICEFIRSVFGEQAARKGIKLTCETARHLPHALLLDRVRLRQILVNLVGNAVKFTDQGHIRLRVDARWQPESSSLVTLELEVEDTGVGIPGHKLESIFNPFVQAEPHAEKERLGTGLGLAIVLRLVHMMGGTVDVGSVVGQGTTFSITVPNVAVSIRLPARHQSEVPVALDFNALTPARLVIVDDNAINRELMAGLFQGTHHELFFGATGRDAVDLVRLQRPDVVLLDIRMPVLDGRQALAEIRQLPGCEMLPVIAVTASGLLQEEQQLRSQFSGYIGKPFTQRELFNELARFLRPHAEGALPARSSLAKLPPADPTRWPALAGQLQELESAEWPNVRDSGAVSEARAFAEKLRSMGGAAACPPVVAYAAAVFHHAELYAIPELEQELARFPGLVRAVQETAATVKPAQG